MLYSHIIGLINKHKKILLKNNWAFFLYFSKKLIKYKTVKNANSMVIPFLDIIRLYLDSWVLLIIS